MLQFIGSQRVRYDSVTELVRYPNVNIKKAVKYTQTESTEMRT